ncbi:hypothetical protein Dda_5030 [Drechslerella dactyloides]|uniref:Uncharacterized protein n=1 Tax=Drechslerella dactyloides TaxID=74499 RepID=A0AAD6NJX6_DREDA|nr:hypothetical protein Dda_5030 [Drechslerella dactyloides]
MRHRNPTLLMSVFVTAFGAYPADACPTDHRAANLAALAPSQAGNGMKDRFNLSSPQSVSTVEGMYPSPVVPGKLYANPDIPDESNQWTLPILHADSICYPLILPAHVSAVSCNTKEFCLPLPPRENGDEVNFYPKNQPKILWHRALDFRSVFAPTPAPQQNKRMPREQVLQPVPTEPDPVVTVIVPATPGLSEDIPPNVYPGQPNVPIATLQAPLPPPRKPCSIPLAYKGICHSAVIPCVVILTYFTAAIVFYPGQNLLAILAPLPPPLSQPPRPQPQRGEPRYFYPDGHDFYEHGPGPFGMYPPPDVSPIPQASGKKHPSDAMETLAYYFLATMVTYGAGLIILGSFLGGLCNCVKKECEFTGF